MLLPRTSVAMHDRIEEGKDIMKGFRMPMGVGENGDGESWPIEWMREGNSEL